MIKQNLNTDWTLRRADSQESLPCFRPHQRLYGAGRQQKNTGALLERK